MTSKWEQIAVSGVSLGKPRKMAEMRRGRQGRERERREKGRGNREGEEGKGTKPYTHDPREFPPLVVNSRVTAPRPPLC